MKKSIFALGLAFLTSGLCLADENTKQVDPPPPWPETIDGARVYVRANLDTYALQDDRRVGIFRSDEFSFAFMPDPNESLVYLRDNFRMFRFDKSGGTAVPVTLVRPDLVREVKKDQAAITLPGSWLKMGSNERWALLARVTGPDPVTHATSSHWVGLGISDAEIPSRWPKPSKVDYSPSIAPSQELADGSKAFAARMGVKETLRDLLPNQNGTWFDLALDATVSTQRLDPAGTGRAELQIGRRFGPSLLNQFGLQIGAQSNQSMRAQVGYAHLGLTYFIPGHYAQPSRTLIFHAAPILTASVRAEQRWRRDDDVSPHHISPDLYYGQLGLQVGPLWLFPKQKSGGSFLRDFALFAELNGYYFPNDQSLAGFATRRFESNLKLELTLPLHVLYFIPSITFETGATEGQTFARKTTFGIGLSARL